MKTIAKKSILEKNKDILFAKLWTIANLEEFKDWKENNFLKLMGLYKSSLKQLRLGNTDFLNRFNLLYSTRKIRDLENYIINYKKI